MKYRLIKEDIVYNGEQLRSNYAYTHFGIVGDSIIAFGGKCDVKLSAMIDIEDMRAGKRIYSESMLHFIIEHHDVDLEKAVLRQFLITDIVKDQINEIKGKLLVQRTGDDLYDGDAKLSVSIATVTPISSMIHFGLNIISQNTPVKTKGLRDYEIDPYEFAIDIMKKYAKDQEKIYMARCKVKWTQ
jgi:hypothetical protein